jgi:hypothetical protein
VSLASLDRVQSIGGGLALEENPALTTAGFAGLRYLRGDLRFVRNAALTAIDVGLVGNEPTRTQVDGVVIIDNAAMASAQVRVTGGAIGGVTVGDATHLERLELAATGYRRVSVVRAPALTRLDVAGQTVTDDVYVRECPVLARVAIAPDADEVYLHAGVSELTLPARVVLLTLLETRLETLTSPVATELLLVYGNTQLRQLEVGSVGTQLDVASNPLLETFSIVSPTTALSSTARFRGNAALRVVNLVGITSIGYLEVTENPRLETLDARFVRQLRGGLTLTDLPALRQLDLARLTTSGGHVLVTRTGLETVAGLAALAQVEGIVRFTANAGLPTCQILALFARVTATSESQDGNDDAATCD